MSYTKSTLRTAVLKKADAIVGSTVSPFFDVTASTGDVDRTIGMVFDREWRRILNANQYFRIQKVTVSTDASTGRIALTSLNSGSADTLKRMYRILTVVKGNIPYQQVEYKDMPLAESLGAFPYSWYQEGTNIFPLPKELSASFDIMVNYIPQRPDKLSGEGITVDFPEEWEELIVFEAAAWLLVKGGNETKAAAELRAGAEDIRNDMLEDVSRLSTNPDRMRFADHPFTWGG